MFTRPAPDGKLRTEAARENRKAKVRGPRLNVGKVLSKGSGQKKQRSQSTGVTDTQKGDEIAELFLGQIARCL